jgi:hypothetical protein
MTTHVTDAQAATLRAYLAGDQARYAELHAQLDRRADARAYTALIIAAFFTAVDQRFAKNGTAADVTGFVTDLRTRSDRLAQDIDPQATERVIRAALTDEDISDLNDEDKGRIYTAVLAALIADAHLDDTDLEALLTEARITANRWISRT